MAPGAVDPEEPSKPSRKKLRKLAKAAVQGTQSIRTLELGAEMMKSAGPLNASELLSVARGLTPDQVAELQKSAPPERAAALVLARTVAEHGNMVRAGQKVAERRVRKMVRRAARMTKAANLEFLTAQATHRQMLKIASGPAPGGPYIGRPPYAVTQEQQLTADVNELQSYNELSKSADATVAEGAKQKLREAMRQQSSNGHRS